ncbi:hypothetical protein [Qipengyuania psychrotolerans]|uniref:Uncharacterized protein n=1 Tax=Qipengyuania psychrotolerans TaxID=2867238 RepID=A0ABX8ZAU8_9SPHN|nr:hypothetical protein [Qipengyuania psychrotolerans]QZD86125.1 hypothetical protein K3166_07500 [Qipengyuania psychrotolerans]
MRSIPARSRASSSGVTRRMQTGVPSSSAVLIEPGPQPPRQDAWADGGLGGLIGLLPGCSAKDVDPP